MFAILQGFNTQSTVKKKKKKETKQLKSQAFATYVPLVETISDLKCRPLRAINIMTFLMAILKYATPN